MRQAVLLAGVVAWGCGDEPSVEKRTPLPPDDRPALITDGPLSSRVASYEIDATLDAGERRIEATQLLTWTHPGDEPADVLPFHLYLNAFKNETTLFMKSSGGRHRGQTAGEWGWIDVTSIRIAGRDGELLGRARFPGPDQTVLELPLDEPVEPGETVEISMAFTAQLPEAFARTGYRGEMIMAGQWFPKIGVRIEGPRGERWHCEPFHVNSEFFADFGAYDVSLTVPETHVVAATGVRTEVAANGDGTRTLRYRAEDVHDFAWMADPFMRRIEGTARNQLGEVAVRVYYRPEQESFARRHLRAAIGSVEAFSRLYIDYPYAIMTIIDPPPAAAGSIGGMEYPTLVTTAGDSIFTPSGVRLPEYVTVHEVGHNWFQGILASNEVEEAWLDEGINEYADSVVMDELYGPEGNLVDWMGYRADLIEIHAAQDVSTLPAPIATRAPGFPDKSAYSGATYTKTGLALRTLENITGVERFRAAMKQYARTWAFRHPTGRDFFAALEQSLGEELDDFFEPAFHGRGAVDLRVRETRCRDHREPAGVFGTGDDRREVEADALESEGHLCEVLVVNLGQVPVPVDVELTFADGSTSRHRWAARDPGVDWRWHWIRVEHDAVLQKVVIDPDRQILLDTSLLESGWRKPETRATRAAGGRAQFWTQTLMQLGGL